MAFSNVSAKPLRLRTLILNPLPSTNLFQFWPCQLHEFCFKCLTIARSAVVLIALLCDHVTYTCFDTGGAASPLRKGQSLSLFRGSDSLSCQT